ncbi:MAG TPA: deoxyguanosinetriphosphate triphosphohydrolase [Anaerolineae bacterium]|nr:deoxyguanosinetriphosphate triphosphohydrolase [Anaerolineae bacterium]
MGMLTRDELEELEIRRLAPYAVMSRNSRGREYTEPEHPYRTAFQRDRDRIIHTTAFRRLEYKTQVFVNYEGDYYRTRLTHTIETAQIARTMARALGLNEDLTEAVSLAHDLGHTPFGHSGEVALDELMEEHGGFNHNYQSLRMVEELAHGYPDFRGLNLTWEVREGIVKHTTEYDKSDAANYEPDKRAMLEGQLVNAADEIAYTTHDLDDGLRSGLIQASALRDVQLWPEALGTLGLQERDFGDMERHRVIRSLINLEVTDALKTVDQRLQESNVQSAEDVRSAATNLVGFSPELQRRNRELKDFLLNRLYRHHRVMRMQVKAQRIIRQLFEAYLSESRQLPLEVQDRLAHGTRERIICDYIAGMTDRFAIEEHQKLFDPSTRG